MAHKKVARWTKHLDLFSKRMVFVPINEHLHW
jgi:Ulp1 family protease